MIEITNRSHPGSSLTLVAIDNASWFLFVGYCYEFSPPLALPFLLLLTSLSSHSGTDVLDVLRLHQSKRLPRFLHPPAWMSSSRSRTPTPNPSIINSASLLDSTTSRPHTYDEITSIQHSGEDESQAHNTLRPPISHSSNPDPGTSASHSIPRVRSAESSPEPPMAKHLHREIIDARDRPRPRPSTASDSQDGREDIETDTKKSGHSQYSSLSSIVLKKKRTRTLTTPHQAAVLHALLAQVCHPYIFD